MCVLGKSYVVGTCCFSCSRGTRLVWPGAGVSAAVVRKSELLFIGWKCNDVVILLLLYILLMRSHCCWHTHNPGLGLVMTHTRIASSISALNVRLTDDRNHKNTYTTFRDIKLLFRICVTKNRKIAVAPCIIYKATVNGIIICIYYIILKLTLLPTASFPWA